MKKIKYISKAKADKNKLNEEINNEDGQKSYTTNITNLESRFSTSGIILYLTDKYIKKKTNESSDVEVTIDQEFSNKPDIIVINEEVADMLYDWYALNADLNMRMFAHDDYNEIVIFPNQPAVNTLEYSDGEEYLDDLVDYQMSCQPEKYQYNFNDIDDIDIDDKVYQKELYK